MDRLCTATPRATHVCPRCGRVYKYLPSLRNHIKLECGIEPKFACPHCDYRARHKHHLHGHMRTKHHLLL